MSDGRYICDLGPYDIVEKDGVSANNPVISRYWPLVCRWPTGQTPKGFIVFCHGLGSNGREYAALSRHWARHGYLVIHPTFGDAINVVARAEPQLGLDPDADLTGWTALPDIRARMHGILHMPSYWRDRLTIVDAVMDAFPDILATTCGAVENPAAGAIAGHSFGAYTAQLLAGAQADLPDGTIIGARDPRFAAALILSGQGRDQQGLRDGSWDAMTGPVLTLTGTLDRGAKGGDWRWKAEPYELAPAGNKYLAVLDDADHYLGGFAEGTRQRQVPTQQEAVKQITLAYLDAHLRNHPAARDWMLTIDGDIGGCPLLFKHK